MTASITEDRLRQAIHAERERRWRLEMAGEPYRHWQTLPRPKKPKYEEVWCDYCVGYFWWEHLASHENNQLCWHAINLPEQHNCACIDCAVASALSVRTALSG